MKKSNLRLLTKDELFDFKNKYLIELQNDFIVVKVVNFNRPTLHSINNSFFLSLHGRKIIISKEAIDLWISQFNNIHLVELQNLINKLIIMYQEVNAENIKKLIGKEK